MKSSATKTPKRRRIASIYILSLAVGLIGAAELRADSLDAWLSGMVPRSADRLVANISPQGAALGAVIASPSRQSPNYFYHWIRDAALVMDTVLALEHQGYSSEAAQGMLWNYARFSRGNQLTLNWSGGPGDTGLGEPKFMADGSAYDQSWARPQNDGPALRAVTLIHFAQELIDQGREADVRNYLYDNGLPAQTVIKADLEYVAHHWMESSFDLWEEVRGMHFYTRMAQRRALIEGADLADRLGDASAASYYRTQATQLSEQILSHWDSGRGIIVATVGQDAGLGYKSTGLDTAVILGVLHGSLRDGFFGPCSDPVLLTAESLKSAFQSAYLINQRTQDWGGESLGVAVGRYPEDRYDGYGTSGRGNAWFLSTSGMAELYYRCSAEWKDDGVISVTSGNVGVLRQLLSRNGWQRGSVQVGETLVASDPRFVSVVNGLHQWGDAMLRRVRFHAGQDGTLTEQMNRDSGYMQGAVDLSWSYAALLTAAFSR